MITTIQLKSVLCGTELFVTQEGIPNSIPTEMKEIKNKIYPDLN